MDGPLCGFVKNLGGVGLKYLWRYVNFSEKYYRSEIQPMGPLDPPASLRHKTGDITQYRQITKVYSTILLRKRITHFISAQLVDYHILGLLNEIFPLPLTHHHFPICIPILHNSEMYSNSNSVGANHDHQMTRWLQDRLFLLLAQKEWRQTFKASTHKIKYSLSF